MNTTRLAMAFSVLLSTQTLAFGTLPVIDFSNLAQSIKQVTHMIEEIALLQQQGSVTSVQVIEAFNQFVAEVPKDKPVWVVLDNASIHTSKAFRSKHAEWEKAGVSLQYLSPYSPELNLIEILWKHIKYFWLEFSAYANFESLKKHLSDLLDNIGKKYQITFA